MQESCFLKSQSSLYHSNACRRPDPQVTREEAVGSEKILRGEGGIMVRIEPGPHTC